MTINEFFKDHRNAVCFCIELYEVNENIYKDTDTRNVDDLPEEWGNAEVQNWYVSDNTFYIDVIK